MHFMLALYMILVAIHLVAIIVTGIMWVILDIFPRSALRKNYRDIRAVHFGSLYLVPMFLGFAWAFTELQVPWWHWGFFPLGLFLLVAFSSLGYMFPLPEGVDQFYYWTRGWPLVLAMVGLVCLAFCMLWTATVLVVYSIWPVTGVPW
jgi:hypothetical protein